VRCGDLGLVAGRHRGDRRVVLAGQGLEHRGLHDPAQPVQSEDVTGQQVVLDDAPVLGPELADDGVVILVDDRVAACGFAARQVEGALARDQVFGNVQDDRAVDRPAIPPVTGRWPSRSAVAAASRPAAPAGSGAAPRSPGCPRAGARTRSRRRSWRWRPGSDGSSRRTG
jgi:hypothetical protein